MKDLNSKILNKLGEIDSFIINNIRDRNLMRSFVQSLVINELTKEIKISKRETDFELRNFFKEKSISDNKDLKKYLLYYGITEKNLNYQIELPLKILKYAENNLHKKVNSHFLKRKESLDLYTYNIIRLENNDLAYELYFQLDGGESDFARLSLEYSIDNELFPKGKAGPTSLNGTHPIIVENLRRASPGDLLEPFKVERWWLILKLIKRNEACLDDKVTQSMHLELFHIHVEEIINQLFKDQLSIQLQA